MYRIGFDVGGTKIAAGLVNDAGQVEFRQVTRFPLGQDGTQFAHLLREMTQALVEDARMSVDSFSRIGVALPGSLDAERTTVLDAHNLGFHHLPLKELLQAEFPAQEITLVNDADAAALAEFKAGALVGCQTGVLITLGTGVGGGLILGGRLFSGGLGHGVELGHMLLHQGGYTCTCGQQGCAECYCSASALAREGRKSLKTSPHSQIARRAHGAADRVSARLVVDCARSGDKTALRLFNDFAEELSYLLASIVNILDPEIIALGGGVGASGDFLCDPVRKLVEQKCFYHTCGQIVPARMGNDAGMVGAALVGEHLTD